MNLGPSFSNYLRNKKTLPTSKAPTDGRMDERTQRFFGQMPYSCYALVPHGK